MARHDPAFAADLQAREVLRRHAVTSLPVDVLKIAQAEGITVEAKPASTAGVSGMLIRVGNKFAIGYATHIDNKGFQRFSIGHELGHYFMSEHIAELFAKSDVHLSRGGFVSKDPRELEADHFSASLLMPRALFIEAARTAGEGLEAVETLHDICQTSLTATAIRFAQFSDLPVAMVMSTGRTIDYCFMSEPLKKFRGVQWIRKGTPLPRSSPTYTFNQDPGNISDERRDEGSAPLQDWFAGDIQCEAFEEIVGLGSYGRTLTIISLEDAPDEEELEEEDDLVESWTPRFRR